jgi:hypothetical protein
MKKSDRRMEERLWRIHQRSVKFKDRKKDSSKKACRKGNW